MRKRLIGLPGTGKTTRLLQQLEKLLETYSPIEIIYSSFSNAAVNEVKERVLEKFTSIKETNLKYFRTIHSLCLRLLKDRKIMRGNKPATPYDFQNYIDKMRSKYPHLDEFLDDIRLLIAVETWFPEEVKRDPLSLYTLGTAPNVFFIQMFEYLQSTFGVTPLNGAEFTPYLDTVLERVDIPDRFKTQFVTELVLLERYWVEFKKENNLFEFSELLNRVLSRELIPPVKVLIVDEYQDSSYLQSRVVELWSNHMEIIIVAGDPNQAIYGFNGASPKYLEEFKYNEAILLSKTWRCPRNVVEYSRTILDNSWTKEFVSAKDINGSVYQSKFEGIDFGKYDSIFVLGRNKDALERAKIELAGTGQVFLDDISSKLVPAVYQLYYAVEHEKKLKAKYIWDIIKERSTRSYQLIDQAGRMLLQEMYNKDELETYLNQKLLSMILTTTKLSLLNTYILQILDNRDIQTYHNLKIKQVDPNQLGYDLDKIQFMTMHAAKGMEADLVILINEASWYERQDLIDENEEKRLHFVAVTRSKRDVAIVELQDSYPTTQFLPQIPAKLSV